MLHLGGEEETGEGGAGGKRKSQVSAGVGGRRGSGGPGCWQGCRNPGEWPVPHYPDPLPPSHIHTDRRGPHMAP